MTDLYHGAEGVNAKRIQWDEFNVDTFNAELESLLTAPEIANNDPKPRSRTCRPSSRPRRGADGLYLESRA